MVKYSISFIVMYILLGLMPKFIMALAFTFIAHRYIWFYHVCVTRQVLFNFITYVTYTRSRLFHSWVRGYTHYQLVYSKGFWQ